jgi:hypothetical protein
LLDGAWGTRPGGAGWSEVADITDDGVIDIRDAVAIRFNWGRPIPP